MIVNKPSIFLYTFRPDRAIIKEICAGIEEEGVLFEIVEKEASSADQLAFDAANDSILGSGIGITGKDAVMQMASLPIGKNVFTLRNASDQAYRILGENSARAIKKMPFKEV
jgi:hypothetical protein